jgi:hypothetical protein
VKNSKEEIVNDISSLPLILNMLILVAFLAWSVIGIVLGARSLGNRPLLIPTWLLNFQLIILSFMLFFQLASEFNLVNKILSLVILFLSFFIFRRYFSGYSILDAVEEDLLDCLKTVAGRHNISYTQSKSRFVLGNEKNFVEFFASGITSANIYIDKKSFPESKEFVSDLRLELEKRTLDGPPKMGRMLLLSSLAFLVLCILPLMGWNILRYISIR